MKGKLKIIFLFFLMFFLLLSFSLVTFAQKYGPIKVALGQSEEHSEGKFALKFKELVEEKTNGEVTVEVYPRGQLGSQRDFIEGLRMGTLEVSWVTIGFFSVYEPILNIFELPYLYSSREHAFWMVNGPLEKMIRERVEKHGVKLLAFFEAGPRNITNNVRPIFTPEDLKGLKIRVPESKVNIDSFTILGANPVPLSFSELYLALQQGVFDGQENPYGIIYTNKFWEVQKYLSKTNHMFLMHMVMYSEKLWNQLPQDIQEKIEEAAQEAAVYEIKVAADEEKSLEGVLKEKGMEINEVDITAFREAVKPLYQKYIAEYGPEAEKAISLIQMSQFN
ncbi:MAG: TRAP transporter substrate-binding protein [Caldisericia bacterium]|nr:TRAP transporter substrate-binding protein [Caldisericia bacterium]